MPTLYTTVEINAPRQDVWRVLFHKESWLYWNTVLYDCNPALQFAEGRSVWLCLRRVPGDEGLEFQPVVLWVQPNSCLKWVATFPGLRWEQVFELQDVGGDRTQYTHQETFSGPLTRFFLPSIRTDEQQGMRRMATELKDFVETARVYC